MSSSPPFSPHPPSSPSPSPSSSTFAARMARLAEAKAERSSEPLPNGFVRCPFHPAHAVPLAALVSHITAVHGGDALSAVPDAMYSLGTRERRRRFLQKELYAPHKQGRESEEKTDRETGTAQHRQQPLLVVKRARAPSWEMPSGGDSGSDD